MSLRFYLVGRVASGINGVLGAWVMLSPIAFGYVPHHDSDTWAALVVGGILMMFGMMRLLSPGELPILSWINLALGTFVLLSPWLLRFASNEARTWSDVALGAVVMVLAACSARVTLLMRQRLSR
jgi:SPW repeat